MTVDRQKYGNIRITIDRQTGRLFLVVVVVVSYLQLRLSYVPVAGRWPSEDWRLSDAMTHEICSSLPSLPGQCLPTALSVSPISVLLHRPPQSSRRSQLMTQEDCIMHTLSLIYAPTAAEYPEMKTGGMKGCNAETEGSERDDEWRGMSPPSAVGGDVLSYPGGKN